MAKSSGQRTHKNIVTKPSDAISDPRFANIQNDPRFHLPSKRNTHVEINKRFAPILEDEAFSSSAKVDRYGRKLSKGRAKQELQKYYRIEHDTTPELEGGEEQERIDDEAVLTELKRLEDKNANADRIEQSETESSDSSSEDDDNDENLVVGKYDEVSAMLQENGNGGGVPRGELSSQLAVVNLDWDNIRAPDLLAVFQSFIPANGQILKIAVYPSEFGKERMEKEELEGPPKEIFAQNLGALTANNDEDEEGDFDEEDSKDEDDERIKRSILKENTGAEFSSAHLRRYQLSRLRYYYAVITCSSKSVASAIYDAVDGTEYLTTANFFDLRYIPDDMSFENDIPRDECTKLPDGYRPNEFVTDALQHSKVKLTWDADDGVRKEVQKRLFGRSRKDIDENDLKAYLGSDSEENETDPNVSLQAGVNTDSTTLVLNTNTASDAPNLQVSSTTTSKKEAERHRMRALLGLPSAPKTGKRKANHDAPVGDLQVTFTSGLSAPSLTDDGKERSVFANEPEREETTVEKYVRKEKERKARRREKSKQNRATGGAAGAIVNKSESAEVKPTDMKEGGPAAAKGEVEDLGFEDPFFSSAASPAKLSNTKAARRQKRAEREAAESAYADSATKRQGLETLISSRTKVGGGRRGEDEDAEDDDVRGEEQDNIKHFNINALARGEKIASKRSGKMRNKQKLSARDKEALEAREKDDFQINVADERFREVYENADFAIDPSHPRFRGTEGMRRLLEEGRNLKRDRGDSEFNDVNNNDDYNLATKKQRKGRRRRGEDNGRVKNH